MTSVPNEMPDASSQVASVPAGLGLLPDSLKADHLAVREQAKRYLTAVYGPDVIYRAPETFPNLVERWIVMVALGEVAAADEVMAEIERQAADTVPNATKVRALLNSKGLLSDGTHAPGWIRSIKEIRVHWGLGLVEAKDLYESLAVAPTGGPR